jgi:hypothetical protein
MLDNCELKKAYVLNPLATEFVPRARREKEAYLQVCLLNVLFSVTHFLLGKKMVGKCIFFYIYFIPKNIFCKFLKKVKIVVGFFK